MSILLKILIVEDVATDMELVAKELERAAIGCEIRRVDTAVDYRRELESFRPQMILSDLSMPRFDGMEALAIARRTNPDIPFIFVSGTLGEDNAVRALREGATDYVLKHNLQRLAFAVSRAMRESQERSARRALEQGLRESERRYRALFQSNPHPTFVYDARSLRFLAVNDTALTRYGFSRDEFLAMTIKDIHPENDIVRLLERVAQPHPLGDKPTLWQHRTKNGELIDVEIASHDVEFDGKQARIVVASKVTRT
jgi:PAS domain S-box-containing protein